MVAFLEADVTVLLSHPHSVNKYLSACFVSGVPPTGDLAVNKTDGKMGGKCEIKRTESLSLELTFWCRETVN